VRSCICKTSVCVCFHSCHVSLSHYGPCAHSLLIW
jgi:hypothetical protein